MSNTTVETHPNVLSATAVIGDSTNTTSHKLLCHFMVKKVFNEGDLDFLDLLMAPDAVSHEMEIFGPSAARGPEAVRQFIRVFRSAFPDLRVTVLDQIGEGERVVTRWQMEGTQKNRLMGIEATHRFMRIEGIRIDRIANGRIAETWNKWDTLDMLRQLGATPPLKRRPVVAPVTPAFVSIAA
ncbi:MAG TPA: ester cyclase [Thermoanaerobaculia bacterium]|nr:ester cyclase [Thermoanaerobaculia bacterium]